jgi:hypothetical protein
MSAGTSHDQCCSRPDLLVLRGKRLSAKATLALMAALFSATHAGYYASGVRFDSTPLTFFFQYLDPELLRHRLGESLFYLHSQPPIFNLFLGGVLKAFPGRETLAFQTIYLLMGFGLYVVLFQLLRKASVSPNIAFALSTWFMVSPSFVLYEHWLFYTFPLALLLATSALLFWRTLEDGRWVWPVTFFVVLFLICGTRSMFHLVYYVLVAAATAMLSPHGRRMVVLAAVVPGLALGLVCVKNFVLFGVPTTSSWVGMNLWATTVGAIPADERERYIREGKLSSFASIRRFSALESYPESVQEVARFEDIPALSEPRKSTGATNYNHLGYIAISQAYLRDALWVVRHRPGAMLIGQLNSWLSYFRSSADYPLLYGNLDRVTAINCLYDYAFYGKVPFLRLPTSQIHLYFAPHSEPRLFILLLVVLPLLVVRGLRLAVQGQSLTRNQRALLGYICLNIIYVAMIGNLCDVGENQRFRFMTDPLYVVLLGLALQDARLQRAGVGLAAAARSLHKRRRPKAR